MAKKEKKSSKSSKIKSLASKGLGHNRAKYLQSGDLVERDIHKGNTSHRGSVVFDSPLTNRNLFALGVRGNNPNASGFVLAGRTYRYTSPTGSSHERVQV